MSQQKIEEAEADLIAMRVFVSELKAVGDPRHSDYLRRSNSLWVLIERARNAGQLTVEIPSGLLS